METLEDRYKGLTYYNDFDKGCCGWLHGLRDAELISNGMIECKSIKDVSADLVSKFL